jgi:protease I
MKSLILTWENFQDQELVYPYYRLREEASIPDDVKVIANVKGKFFGIMGVNMNAHILISELSNESFCNSLIKDNDLLVLPGGVKALEKLRQEKVAINFLKHWGEEKKAIASTCHGAQLLISAGLTKGKKISGYYSIEDDIRNSGATYVNEPFVVDGNIVTSPHYDWMGEWMHSAINLAKELSRS